MAWFRRAQSTRAYPAAGTSVTADAGRFRRAKTTGAHRADRKAQKWEDADRKRERRRQGHYR
ncbi:hypothetical protein ACFW2X_06685 [Streptomyces antibioticus]|uniref:hypothetical protein n=1 Tax=Streptomyces antibioticus TaxID=1890 RepID=UPI0036A755DB